jgi:hypothetical protein
MDLIGNSMVSVVKSIVLMLKFHGFDAAESQFFMVAYEFSVDKIG